MKRKPGSSPPELKHKKNTGTITQERRYKLITPLYGGGVEPNKADPITVVRGTEVRGHLRFWWRATRGGKYSTIDELQKQESLIWGGTENASDVFLSITLVSPEKIQYEPAFEVVSETVSGEQKKKTKVSPNVAPYAAFPLQPDKDKSKIVEWESDPVARNVQFVLEISFSAKFEKDVEAALWAWETFGGIGARTRRGFGALERLDRNAPPLPTSLNAQKWLEKKLVTHVVKNKQWLPGVPHLSLKFSSYKITAHENNSIEAWKYIVSRLKAFRQEDARYTKKTGKQDDYGTSRWPEANEVRRLFDRDPILVKGVTKSDLVQKFPRANFGLPIIFHMPHDKGLPENITLQGAEKSYNRLASPLILRPLACKKGAVGLAAILESPRIPPGGLKLKNAPYEPSVESKLEPSDIKKIPSLKSTKTDVLQAFLETL